MSDNNPSVGDFGFGEWQHMLAELNREARERALENDADPNNLVTLSEARILAAPVVTENSQNLSQMARLFHYMLFSDEEGSLRQALKWKPEDPIPEQICRRYEILKSFVEELPLDGSGSSPEESTALQRLPEALHPLSAAQFALLARQAMALLQAWEEEDFLFGFPDECLLSPSQVATVLRKRHGTSYTRNEHLLTGSADTSVNEEIEQQHLRFVLEVNEALGVQHLTLQMHPVAYLNHLESLASRVDELIRAQSKATKKHLGVSRGNTKHDLSVTDEAKIHIQFLRWRFGSARSGGFGTRQIEKVLLKELSDPDREREINKLKGEFKKLPWAENFISASATDPIFDDIATIYDVSAIPIRTWLLSVRRLHKSIERD